MMKTQLLEEVLECLRGERTVFTYYRDAYAAYLLQRVITKQNAVALRELKQSRWASLLNRPVIREIIARCGDGYLHKEQLGDIWSEKKEPFVLTVGNWGHAKGYAWHQISRPGSNLVLQLNMSNKWHQLFHSLVRESANDYFGYYHPLSNTRKMTLAWARLDFDFDTNEVLVEEIQTDLVRHIGWMQKKALVALAKKENHFYFYDTQIRTHDFCQFAKDFLSKFKKRGKKRC